MNMGKCMVKEQLKLALAEEYRKVATNIQFANIDNNIKTVMITSSVKGEGKTTTACNLAAIMTDLEKNILLIDMDFRKPSVHKFFNLSNKKGLTDLLMNKDDYEKYINCVYPKLNVITAGKIPSNSAEIVNSKSIRELLIKLSLHYDYIFLDTPPIALVSDPIAIATYIDAVILIISYGQTEIEIAKKSVDSLKRVNANLIGTIINKSPVTKHDRNYYYDYY